MIEYYYRRYSYRMKQRYFGERILDELFHSSLTLPVGAQLYSGYQLSESQGFSATGSAIVGESEGRIIYSATPLYVYEFRPIASDDENVKGDIYLIARCYREEYADWSERDYVDTVRAPAGVYPNGGVLGDYYYTRQGRATNLYARLHGEWLPGEMYLRREGRWRLVRAYGITGRSEDQASQ